MNNIKLHIAFPTLLVLFFMVFAQAQDSYQLQYKFQKGKTYRYKSTSTNDMTQEAMGQEMKMTGGSDLITRLVIENVLTDGSMVMVVSADSAVSRTKSPMRDTTMVLSNVIGKRMRITVTRTGEVKAREVIDSVRYETRGVTMRVPQREMMSLTNLPQKQVKIGEKWNQSKADTTEMMGGKTITTSDIDYTLAGTENRMGHSCLKIAFTGKTTTTGKMVNMGMEMFTEGSGKVSGTIFFDHKQGLPVSVESTSEDERTVATTGQQNMTMQMSSTGKSTSVLFGN